MTSSCGEVKSFEAELKKRWEAVTEDVEPHVRQKWWDVIRSMYSEGGRKYHTLCHLYKMFSHMDAHLADIVSQKALSYAIFFHDIVYDVQSQTNEEKSVEKFEEFCEESGIKKDIHLTSKVKNFILLSKSHCTEAHITPNTYGSDDEHYFLDFDISILGSPSSEYQEYASQIREEYSYLPVEQYNSLRAKVLKLFLQIPNIFATKPFREKYEETAKTNIQWEISNLNKTL